MDKQDKCPTCGKDYKSEDPIFCSNSFHKQDKTAYDILYHRLVIMTDGFHDADSFNEQMSHGYGDQIVEAMESYAQHRTAELEAKIKALKEQLEAADELIEHPAPSSNNWDSLYEKYQSLKK